MVENKHNWISVLYYVHIWTTFHFRWRQFDLSCASSFSWVIVHISFFWLQ